MVKKSFLTKVVSIFFNPDTSPYMKQATEALGDRLIGRVNTDES